MLLISNQLNASQLVSDMVFKLLVTGSKPQFPNKFIFQVFYQSMEGKLIVSINKVDVGIQALVQDLEVREELPTM